MPRLMKVTAANYYSEKANRTYMSASQYKAFARCEAAALAELCGIYERPQTTALLVGSYVDAYFEGTLDTFRAEHPEVFKKDGTLKAEFAEAERIIARLEEDELFGLLMSGEKQVIKTGKIGGVPFKIKIDSLLSEAQVEEIVTRFPDTAAELGYPFSSGAIVDLKIMKDLAPVWSDTEHRRVPFVEAYGYDFQGAIYREVDGRELPFVLDIGTKEAEPNIAALSVPPEDLAPKLAEVEQNARRYHDIKRGKITPTRCENCAYCRRTRRLSTIVPYKKAGGVGEWE